MTKYIKGSLSNPDNGAQRQCNDVCDRRGENNLQAEDSLMENKIVMIILGVILPPLAVFLKKGAGKDLVINILLCIVFFFPGVIHALWLVTKD